MSGDWRDAIEKAVLEERVRGLEAQVALLKSELAEERQVRAGVLPVLGASATMNFHRLAAGALANAEADEAEQVVVPAKSPSDAVTWFRAAATSRSAVDTPDALAPADEPQQLEPLEG